MKNKNWIFIVPIISMSSLLWGGESLVKKEVVPWVEAQAVYSTGDVVYVSAQGSISGDNTRLWRSLTGDTWEPVSAPDIEEVVFQSFSELNNQLYAFGSKENGNPLPERVVFRTPDGLTWSRIDTPGQFGDGYWSDSETYNGQIYFAAVTRQDSDYLWRLSENNGIVWENLGIPSGYSFNTAQDHYLVYSVFNGLLNMSFVSIPNTFSDVRVWPTSDGTFNGARKLQTSGYHLLFGFAEFESKLFWGSSKANSGRTVDGTDWDLIDFTSFFDGSILIFPATLHDRLYLFNPAFTSGGGQFRPSVLVQRMINENEYVPTEFLSPDVCVATPRKVNIVAHHKDRAYVLFCDLHELKKGAFEINLEPFLTNDLIPGQKDSIVFAWSVKFNFEEKIFNILVKNAGTAEAGQEIQSLKLFRDVGSAPVGSPFEFIADLIPGQDGRTWLTPPREVELQEGDRFIITADITDNPRAGKTVQLFIPQDGFHWESNETLKPGPNFMAPESQTIQAGPNAAPVVIGGVVIAPTPANKTVNFVYELQSTGSIEIKIFDRNGALVSEVNETGKAASNRVITTWDSSSFAPGVYFALVKITEANAPERMIKKKIFIER